jgi:hypothetical protein
MTSTINTDECSNIKLEFEYLDHFLIKISRPFSDCFVGHVYTSIPLYNGELFYLFSLSSHPTIEDVIKDAFQQCDQFLIDNPIKSDQEITYQVPIHPDDIPF